MTGIDVSRLAAAGLRGLKKRAPEILTGVGISGMIATTVLAVKATPEAQRRIEQKKKELKTDKLTIRQTVEAAWKCYIPAGVTGVTSIGCLIGASRINFKRNAALATMVGMSDAALKEYRDKVKETIGDKKEEAVLQAIDRDRVEKDPPPKEMQEPPVTAGLAQPVLCYESMFGQYFWSDKESILKAVNKLNWQMNNGSEPYISVNEFLMEIGANPVKVGDLMGWKTSRGLIEVRFSSQLVNGRMPCLVVSHVNPPDYGYSDA